jgi:hypothetical protein
VKVQRWLPLLGPLVLMAIGFIFLLGGVSAAPSSTVSGIVVDAEGPVAGATVRVQATIQATTSAADGSFTLEGLTEGVTVTISAWKHTYYCGKVEEVVPPASDITITLRIYQSNDNPDYEWLPPTGPDSCASCKPGVTEIWLGNAHAGAGTNPRFFSLYNGTDVTGTATITPGYVLDFPGTAGNCAACHAPGAAVDSPFATNMNALAGADTFGVHCDFCHKVADVYLDPATGLPYRNVPGVISMDVRRPFPESERYQLFFGTFDDDNVPEEDTYLPLIEKSQFCAPCHQFSFWGTPIYQSFREWLESPYPQMGVECQICHMPPDGIMTNVAPGAGGVERDPMTIHAHTQPGASDVELLQNTVTMTMSAHPMVGHVLVTVSITNTGAGHHVPTDFPGRHLILVVTAIDEQGRSMAQTSGPTVPDWGGAQAGLPGKAFAKVLRDVQSGESPVVSYWKQALIASDNRIPALQGDTSIYTFAPAPGQTLTVTAELHFRRMFQDLMGAKRWDVPDILMERVQVILAAPAQWGIFLPLILRDAD